MAGDAGFLVGMQVRGHRDAAVGGVGASAGKHELAGHEGVLLVATPHQHVEFAAFAVEQDQGGRVAGPHRLATQCEVLRFGLVDFGLA